MVRQALEADSFQVVEAKDGIDALAARSSTIHADMVISAGRQTMPEMDGLRLVRSASARAPAVPLSRPSSS